MGRFQKSQPPQSQHHGASSLPSKLGGSDPSPSLTPSPTCLPLASHLSASHPASAPTCPTGQKEPSGRCTPPQTARLLPGARTRSRDTLVPRTEPARPSGDLLLLQPGGQTAHCPHLQAFALLLPRAPVTSPLGHTTSSRTFRAPGKSLCHRAPDLVPRSSGHTGEDPEGLGLVPGWLPFPPTTSGRGAPVTSGCPLPALDCCLPDLCPPPCSPHLSQRGC